MGRGTGLTYGLLVGDEGGREIGGWCGWEDGGGSVDLVLGW